MSRQFAIGNRMLSHCLSSARFSFVSSVTLAIMVTVVFTHFVTTSQTPIHTRLATHADANSAHHRSLPNRSAIAVIVRKQPSTELQETRFSADFRTASLTLVHLFGALMILALLMHTHIRFQQKVHVMSRRLE